MESLSPIQRNFAVVATSALVDSFWNSIVDFAALASHPLIQTLLSILVGGLCLNYLSQKWARRHKRREKAVECIEEVSARFNGALSYVVGGIRRGRIKPGDHEALESQIQPLFLNRLQVRIRAKAYLRSDIFWQRYDLLVLQLNEFANTIAALERDELDAKVRDRILSQRRKLTFGWPVPAAMEQISQGDFFHPDDALMCDLQSWAHGLWVRADDFFSLSLARVL